MKYSFLLFGLLLLLAACSPTTDSAGPNFAISLAPGLEAGAEGSGRIVIKLRRTGGEALPPGVSPNASFATQVDDFDEAQTLLLGPDADWTINNWPLAELPAGTYQVSAAWNRRGASTADLPGEVIRSETSEVTISGNERIELELSLPSSPPELVEHELVRPFSYESPLISAFRGEPVTIKAAVLLPPGYADNPTKRYPVRYNVAGYGGRYTRVQRLVKEPGFMDWYTGGEAPEMITVFLDGYGPLGDHYHLDSENNGPYGRALIEELIPAVEREYRTYGSAEYRFVDGCSTGGWVSLALQLFYPSSFAACFSYSPDPVTFAKMQLINVYEDDNAFYNGSGYLRPSKRDIFGEPAFSIKSEVADENIDGWSGSYVTSRGQWGAWNAVYSPKGADGLPKAIFDPLTGKIDKSVAKAWEQYDLLLHLQRNWETVGPEIAGKVHVYMGDMDNYYLNTSLRDMESFLKQTTAPKSDAELVFYPMTGHCSMYSNREVMERIAEHLNKK